jgi:hypothetical protein
MTVVRQWAGILDSINSQLTEAIPHCIAPPTLTCTYTDGDAYTAFRWTEVVSNSRFTADFMGEEHVRHFATL